MHESQNIDLVFGSYRLCPRRRRLEYNGKPLPVTAKAFDTLLAMLERPGEVVSKDDLMLAVWPDTIVEENNLIQQISHLRKLLNEHSAGSDFILTVPGRGYSFVANVHRSEQDTTELPLKDGNRKWFLPAWVDSLDRERKVGYTWAFVFIAFVCFPFLWVGSPKAVSSSRSQSLAVLGFRTSAPVDKLIGVGIRDTLNARLGSVEDLIVRPGPFDAVVPDAVAAGRDLNVDTVLTGSIQHSEERIRVTLEMIDVASGRIVWGRIFDNNSTNVFELQDSIAGEVTRFLRVKFIAVFEKGFGGVSNMDAVDIAHSFWFNLPHPIAADLHTGTA
jgi:DNA-binding winged helix-turn-helix (wHTH) protein/TolB-like protein